jgi:hypothetical protein
MTKKFFAVEKGQGRSTSSVITKGETDMHTLETALVNYWCRKTLSERDLMETPDLGKVVLRTMIGFAAFAVLILCLDWMAASAIDRPQVAAADQVRLMPEAKK